MVEPGHVYTFVFYEIPSSPVLGNKLVYPSETIRTLVKFHSIIKPIIEELFI